MKLFLKISAIIMLIICSIMMLYGFFATPNISNTYWLPTMVETGTLGFGIALIVLGVSENIEEKKTNKSTEKIIEKVETEIKEQKNNETITEEKIGIDIIVGIGVVIAMIGIAIIIICVV